jgi:uncharacterized lipoprotein
MIKSTKLFICSVLLLVVGGCAFTPHEVQMNAVAPRLTSDVGDGITVGLRFVDDRESSTVGQRGAGMQGADVSASSLMSHVERQSRQILTDKGFTITGYNNNEDSDVKLTISVRAFRFFIETGFWTGANNVDVIIKSEARKGMADYENTYRFNNEERMLVVPDGDGIDQMLNAALSDVLTQMAADTALYNFLAE